MRETLLPKDALAREPTLTHSEFCFIRELVHRRSAILLEPGKEYLAEFRLGAFARREGFPSLRALIERLRAEPGADLHRRVVEVMTTNETSFFRDHHPFEALRQHILPELMKKRERTRALNLWCAASSSGQEPYSVAMVLRELGAVAPSWQLRFDASDLSQEMLARARSGLYSMLEVNRGLPAALLLRHFTPVGADYQVRDELRRMISFSEINLAQAWPAMPLMDVVFLRNVLIYFDVERKREILSRVRRLLRADGYLFLGSAETTFNLDAGFQQVTLGKATCYRLL
jgi:chemotaxis protein methyltransferase CheR